MTSKVTILVRSWGEILAYGEPADGQVEYRLVGDVLPQGSAAVTAEDIFEMCAATDLGALDGLPVRRDTA